MQFALILTIYGSENKNSALSGFQQLLFILTKRQKSRMSTDNTDFMVKGSNDKKMFMEPLSSRYVRNQI